MARMHRPAGSQHRATAKVGIVQHVRGGFHAVLYDEGGVVKSRPRTHRCYDLALPDAESLALGESVPLDAQAQARLDELLEDDDDRTSYDDMDGDE